MRFFITHMRQTFIYKLSAYSHIGKQEKKEIVDYMQDTFNKFKPSFHVNLSYDKIWLDSNTLHLEFKHLQNAFHVTFFIPSHIINLPILVLGDYCILGMNTGQFWSLQPSFYNTIAQTYHNPIECFTSLANKNLKLFYSLLPSEIKYGSKGNFFDKFLSDSYPCFVINPPYTSNILTRVLQLIALKSSCHIYLALPSWPDLIALAEQLNPISHSIVPVFDHITQKNIPYTVHLFFYKR